MQNKTVKTSAPEVVSGEGRWETGNTGDGKGVLGKGIMYMFIFGGATLVLLRLLLALPSEMPAGLGGPHGKLVMCKVNTAPGYCILYD